MLEIKIVMITTECHYVNLAMEYAMYSQQIVQVYFVWIYLDSPFQKKGNVYPLNIKILLIENIKTMSMEKESIVVLGKNKALVETWK